MSSMSSEESFRFTDRIRTHKAVVAESGNAPPFARMASDPLVLAVKDELLVSERFVHEVQDFLDEGGITAQPAGSLLQGLSLPPGVAVDDVVVLALSELPSGTTVFSLTAALREGLLQAEPSAVSPSHVLVPAPD